MESIDPKNFIFLDESGAHLGMSTEYSRAEGGRRSVMPKPFNKGKKFSIIGAIKLIGIFPMMYFSSAIDMIIFKTLSNKFLIPKLKRGQLIIFDNVSFHKSQEIIDLIEVIGAKGIFLPPYLPDLSPIEKMWSKIKEILKRIPPPPHTQKQSFMRHFLLQHSLSMLMTLRSNMKHVVTS